METGLIIIQEYCSRTDIEPSFIELLQSEGLIEVEVINGEQYLQESQLGDLERFARLYYDLSINIEGIDVVHNLMNRMREMEHELNHLRKFFDSHRSLWNDI